MRQQHSLVSRANEPIRQATEGGTNGDGKGNRVRIQQKTNYLGGGKNEEQRQHTPKLSGKADRGPGTPYIHPRREKLLSQVFPVCLPTPNTPILLAEILTSFICRNTTRLLRPITVQLPHQPSKAPAWLSEELPNEPRSKIPMRNRTESG
jgi:hypothetical protein